MKAELPIRESVDLTPLNTLGVSAVARYFLDVTAEAQLPEALAWADARGLPTLLLGGGSNLVFAADFPGLVLRVALRGRQWHALDDDRAHLSLMAGENWHEAVMHAAEAGYRGIENLALIPGTAGAAPVQNIGAYGVELCDTLASVRVLDRQSGRIKTLTGEQCRFGYRDSRFKREPGRYVILELCLTLSRTLAFALDYGDLRQSLPTDDLSVLTAMDVAQTVIQLRQSKLPDPATLANAGSFFKNPVIDSATCEALRERFPSLVSYPVAEGQKLAAGWLIDQAGWKGYRNERVGVHDRQALVLVNHNHGSGEDVLALADEIRASVRSMFGVSLEIEPGVIGR